MGIASVLFVCGENALRSPMAEAIVKDLMGERVFVDSAGVRTGELDQMAVAVMAEIEIDLARHVPKSLGDLVASSFDLVVTLTDDARAPAEALVRGSASELEHWPIPDPSLAEGTRDVRLAAYRDIRDALTARILERLGGE